VPAILDNPQQISGSAVESRTALQTATPTGEAEAPGMESSPAWPMLSRLPLAFQVSVPLVGLRVRDLLELRPGTVVASAWAIDHDVPLFAGETCIAWGEFESVEQTMALRLTRLS